jgi:3-hydroxybutyryl-CoA dehydratase
MRVQVGDKASWSQTITHNLTLAFGQVTGNLNPLNIDEKFAQGTRYGRSVAQGLLVGSMISHILGTKLPGPGTVYLSQQFHWLHPAYIGDTLTATVVVVEHHPTKPIVTLKTDIYNQDGDHVLTGEAVVLADIGS